MLSEQLLVLWLLQKHKVVNFELLFPAPFPCHLPLILASQTGEGLH